MTGTTTSLRNTPFFAAMAKRLRQLVKSIQRFEYSTIDDFRVLKKAYTNLEEVVEYIGEKMQELEDADDASRARVISIIREKGHLFSVAEIKNVDSIRGVADPITIPVKVFLTPAGKLCGSLSFIVPTEWTQFADSIGTSLVDHYGFAENPLPDAEVEEDSIQMYLYGIDPRYSGIPTTSFWATSLKTLKPVFVAVKDAQFLVENQRCTDYEQVAQLIRCRLSPLN